MPKSFFHLVLDGAAVSDREDETGRRIFEIPFASIDRSIAHLPVQSRELIARISQNRRELQKSDGGNARTIRRGRAQRKPYLIAEGGSLI